MAASSITTGGAVSKAYNKDLDDLVEVGDVYYEDGQYEEAIGCYIVAAKHDYPRGWSSLIKANYKRNMSVEEKTFIENEIKVEIRELPDLIKESAISGNSVGQSRLGYLYLFGYGVNKDTEEFFKWTLLSAEQGDPVGQYNLGTSYAEGVGVNQNILEAARWYFFSFERGYEKAKLALDFLLNKHYVIKSGSWTVIETKHFFEILLEKKKWLELNKGQNDNAAKKFLSISQSGYSSDDELNEIEKIYSITFFSREEKVHTIATTIPCNDGNIKGNILIQMAHKFVRKWHEKEVKCISEDSGITPPKADYIKLIGKLGEHMHLSINAPREWAMSLGGWKGMMPKEEIQNYAFFQSGSFSQQNKKFDCVSIFESDATFTIEKKLRIHMPDKFFIGNFDVTLESDGKSHKTDLSYVKIYNVIEHIKINYSKENYPITDSKIAQLQLYCLSRAIPKPEWTALLEQEELKQIVIFLDYLNALMFGIEASGLNAALLTSAMMLDLVSGGQCSYKDAFNANDDGGIYPYACLSNKYRENKGTYQNREEILLNLKSMRDLHNNPSFSAVAAKEAIIIKAWLKYSGVLDSKFNCKEQLQHIDHALEDLCTFYFYPKHEHCYSIEKFKTCSERTHVNAIGPGPTIKNDI